ncbi:DUF3768 domain-containing protein [Loktanella agnita]|uniref:DUF3768 domain-containing protein n=1 Tax=Loktanella agnita TaxID=287097 RepID=UPI0039857C2D
MATDVNDRNAVIAEQNDLVRAALADPKAFKQVNAQGIAFKLVWTPGINEAFLLTGKIKPLAKAIAAFDAFETDDDPYQERDFAALEVEGTKVYFKFDYYNLTMDGGSEDPADPAQTVRVLTVMLPCEY